MNKKQTPRLVAGLLLVSFTMLTCEVVAQQLKPKTAQQIKEAQQKEFGRLKEDKLREFLRDESLRQNDPERLVTAIEKTGDRKTIEALPELISLLTFRREFDWERERKIHPPAPGEVKLLGGIRKLTQADLYPAIGALGQIGDPALPALLEVIKNQDSESLETQNALEAIQSIFSLDLQQTIEFLRHKADQSIAPANQRLYAAAEKTAQRIEQFKKNSEELNQQNYQP